MDINPHLYFIEHNPNSKDMLSKLTNNIDLEDIDLDDYKPGPPKRTFTLRMNAKYIGRGKPLFYPLDNEEE
jgi:hypothetical protein